MKIHYPTAIPFCLKCIYLPVYGDSCRLKGSTKWAGGSWPWPSGEKARFADGRAAAKYPPQIYDEEVCSNTKFQKGKFG